VRLFGSFLAKLKKQNSGLEVFIIPGNHDSPTRLGFGRELFAELGIRFAGEPEESFEPVILKAAGRESGGSGKTGAAIPAEGGSVENGNIEGRGMERGSAESGSCAFFLLPFLNPGSLSAEDSGEPEILRSQAQLAAEAARRLELSRRRWAARGVSRAVLVAHLFAGGGRESESERIFLGSAEKVDMGLFAGFDYVALGHLHRCQRAGQNGWYSGSPLAYSFDEAGSKKAVLSVELGGDTGSPGDTGDPVDGGIAGKARVKVIPIRSLHRVCRLSGPFERFNRPSPQDGELREAAEDYLEFSLADSSLTENALPLLQTRYPRLLSVRQDPARLALRGTGGESPAAGGKRDTAADFEEFLTGLYGQAEEGKVKRFRELLAQAEAEERETTAMEAGRPS
jgi:exonuclease SbcD